MEHTFGANWQWKESIPFSLIHEKDILNLIQPTPLQCFSNCLSPTRVKHLRQDMVQSRLPISKPKITLVSTSTGRILGVVTGMVEGAMVSSFSVACIHALLHLRSSKSFLVTLVQSSMGEPSAMQ